MAKASLHELLAVEGNLENQANKVRTELLNTFEKKRHLFEEKRVSFTPNSGDGSTVTETQSNIQSTVLKELNWIKPHLVKALDASYQVAEANTHARADIVLEDGTVLATQVPATALLELEKRVDEFAKLVAAIPTLDPAKGFVLDDTKPDGQYKAREIQKKRTQKKKTVIIKYAATVEHPAQTELIDEDVPIGNILEQEWSGLITPADKSEYINRAEVLARAVRSARSRANSVEVDQTKKIGDKLLQFVLSK